MGFRDLANTCFSYPYEKMFLNDQATLFGYYTLKEKNDDGTVFVPKLIIFVSKIGKNS